MKNLLVIQEELSDCGVCCLLSIIRYYGGNANLENLRIESITTKEGVNAYNLIECAKKHGFDAKGIKLDDIPESLPCIAHIKINDSLTHFVVIYNVTNDIIEIMDPASGFIKMKKDDFKKVSTNIYLILVPKYKFKYFPIKKTAEHKIYNAIKFKKYSLLKIIILNVISIILTIISSFYIEIIEYDDYLTYLTAIFIIINILIFIISYLINKCFVKLNASINKKLLLDFFNHIFRLPLKYIHIKDKNEIIKRVEEIEVLNNIITNSFINFILNIMIILSIIVIESILFIYNMFPIIILLILSYLVTILSLKNIKSYINETINKSGNYKSYLINYINNITSIYHSNSKHEFLNILDEKISDYLEINKKSDIYMNKITSIKNAISSSFVLLSNLILLFFIVKMKYPITLLVIINYLNNILSNSINNTTELIPGLYYYKSISTKLNEFYNIEEVNCKSSRKIDRYSIIINNLSFSFNKVNSPINNLSLQIKEGEKILIQGESGCGKSTLMRILSKEYDDYKGKIFIGDVNLKNININNLYNNLYYSSQNESIFVDTIQNNITMYKKYSEEELNKVIMVTGLDRLLKKKSFGINTFLYSGGEELSGGEKQLIILARALITNKNIIILDEPLSQIDENIEKCIIYNIIKTYKNNTIIYISHKSNNNYPIKVFNMKKGVYNGNPRK